jgi:hypothetical protein
MEHNIKPITKQLAIAAFILVSVTVLSFGIRQVRFSAYRAESGRFTPSARPSDTEDPPQSEQKLDVKAEPDYYPADSYTVNDKPDPQDFEESFWDEQASSDDYSEENVDSVKYNKAISKAKSFKGDYDKAKASKGLEKISLSNHEDLYFSKEGEFWYVSKEPDGSTTKMQVQIDEASGKLAAVGGGYYAKQEPQKIPMGDNEDIYLTDEGEAWYVSEQPDGTTTKIQLQTD